MMMMTNPINPHKNTTTTDATPAEAVLDRQEVTTPVRVITDVNLPASTASNTAIKTLYWHPVAEGASLSDYGNGITSYLRQLLPALQNVSGKVPTLYTADAKKFKKLNLKQTDAYLATFVEQAQRFECVHLQHEFTMFSGQYLPHQGINLWAGLLEALAKQNAQRPVFTTFHQSPSHLQAPLKVLEQLAWKNVVKQFQLGTVQWAICHHVQIKQQLIASGFAPEKICLMPYFVSRQTVQQHPIQPQLKNEIRQRLKLQPTDTLLGVLGYMSPTKRFEDAVKALSFLPASYKLLIIGGTQATSAQGQAGKEAHHYEQLLVRLIYEAGLQNRVLLTGLFLNEQLPTYLDCVDLFLAPYSQAFSGSFSAASVLMAAKKPLIASNCPAFLEVQHQSQCLALFQAEEVEDLVKTIKQLNESATQQAFLVNALNTYAEEHCEQSVATVMLQAYLNAKSTLLSQQSQLS
jgi:glycosyltransferase involved in cell wall biosynthesis